MKKSVLLLSGMILLSACRPPMGDPRDAIVTMSVGQVINKARAPVSEEPVVVNLDIDQDISASSEDSTDIGVDIQQKIKASIEVPQLKKKEPLAYRLSLLKSAIRDERTTQSNWSSYFNYHWRQSLPKKTQVVIGDLELEKPFGFNTAETKLFKKHKDSLVNIVNSYRLQKDKSNYYFYSVPEFPVRFTMYNGELTLLISNAILPLHFKARQAFDYQRASLIVKNYLMPALKGLSKDTFALEQVKNIALSVTYGNRLTFKEPGYSDNEVNIEESIALVLPMEDLKSLQNNDLDIGQLVQSARVFKHIDDRPLELMTKFSEDLLFN